MKAGTAVSVFKVETLSLLCIFLSWNLTYGQIRYTIPEESARGSVVGNMGKDLGLTLAEISNRKLRVAAEAGKQYFRVDVGKGELVVNERIDLEELCGKSATCVLPIEVIAEAPLQLHRVVVEIQDINDNAPSFGTKELVLTMAEHTASGTRFPLESAQDPDVGSNALRSYTLNSNEYFSVNTNILKDGRKLPELVMSKALDREKQSTHKLVLTAADGGNPVKTGTVQITVNVLDTNDNAPQFEKQTYDVSVLENVTSGTIVIRLKATDLDEGPNGEIQYFFGDQTPESILVMFLLNSETGLITLNGKLDYEHVALYSIDLVAKDKGSPEMRGHSRVQISVVDVNDNAPEIALKSLSNSVLENSPLGTVVGFISARDLDSNDNGKVSLRVLGDVPFTLKQSFENYYELVTSYLLDREKHMEYKVEISATDSGSPRLTTQKSVVFSIQDVNDNPPVFTQSLYTVYVKENSAAGRIVTSVSAADPDTGENAQISYSVLDSKVNDVPISSYIYINSDNGSIYSMHSFDYENLKAFQIHVQASDHGNPSLNSNVTVHVFILDQNDNAPAVIYPSAAMGSLSHQRMPRSAKAGHLVTKVTAVDADSGHNAWISYKLAEATDASLFSVNVYTGEVRTKRAISEQDDSSQRLLVEIRDNGVPAQSATATVSILLEDGFHEPVLDLREKYPEPIRKNGQIAFYLILSLASVSVLSLVTCLILVVKCARSARRSSACCLRRMDSDDFKNPNRNLQLQLNTNGPIEYVEVLGGDMLSHSQTFRSCLSPLSEFSDFTLIKPSSTLDFRNMISVLDASLPDNAWTFESQQQKPPNQDWRFNQNQRPGPSGATANPDVPVGTGPWPQPPTEAEQLQALMAAANEVSEATNTLTPGTMGLSTRYSPQFTLQHVPDYRQNVYIPGSTATLGSNPQQQMLQQQLQQQHLQQQHLQQQQQLQLQQQMLPQREALPPPQAVAAADDADQPDASKANQTPASKKKSTKKDKK
ncbi:protocadherin gamma-C5-like isoform X18 [Clupea harengus]|uniref:Protocadherin gamma-C3 n=1 Tax=Clupea harengus TaxID=7950 RepID=A0A6P8GYL5_CLUHA|nr:protocadherin gamma-C5-like isoform X18 [Clupea harengus]